MKKFFFSLLAAAALLLAACQAEDKADSGKNSGKPVKKPSPEATTGSASEIGEVSVVLSGKAIKLEELDNPEIGVLVGTGMSVSESSATKYPATDITPLGNFTVPVTGLLPGTTYYYKTYIKADGVFTTGLTSNFTTKDVRLVVSVADASGITLESATISGKITLQATGTYPIEANLYWAKNTSYVNSLISQGTVIPLELDADGNFSVQTGPFEMEQTYNYLVTVSAAGKSYTSAVKSFKAPGFEVTVTNGDATEITDTTAMLTSTFTMNATPPFRLAYAFFYSTDPGGPDAWTEAMSTEGGPTTGYEYEWKMAMPSNGSISAVCTGLKPATTYYWTGLVIAVDTWAMVAGEVKSFTTL